MLLHWYHMFYMMLHQHENLCSRELRDCWLPPHRYNGRESLSCCFHGYPRPLSVYSEPLVTTKVYMVYEIIWEQFFYFPLNIFKHIFTTMVKFSVVCVTKSYSIQQKKYFCFDLQVLEAEPKMKSRINQDVLSSSSSDD